MQQPARACNQLLTPLFLKNVAPSPVVDNLPSVPEEKYEKLVNVLKKIYGQIGNIREGEQQPLWLLEVIQSFSRSVGQLVSQPGWYSVSQPLQKRKQGRVQESDDEPLAAHASSGHQAAASPFSSWRSAAARARRRSVAHG